MSFYLKRLSSLFRKPEDSTPELPVPIHSEPRVITDDDVLGFAELVADLIIGDLIPARIDFTLVEALPIFSQEHHPQLFINEINRLGLMWHPHFEVKFAKTPDDKIGIKIERLDNPSES